MPNGADLKFEDLDRSEVRRDLQHDSTPARPLGPSTLGGEQDLGEPLDVQAPDLIDPDIVEGDMVLDVIDNESREVPPPTEEAGLAETQNTPMASAEPEVNVRVSETEDVPLRSLEDVGPGCAGRSAEGQSGDPESHQ